MKPTIIERSELPETPERMLSDEQYEAILKTAGTNQAIIIEDFKGRNISRAYGTIRLYLHFKGHTPHLRRINGKLAVWID